MAIISCIGSRKTPKEFLDVMTQIGEEIVRREWFIRSGGARGADQAFMLGGNNIDPKQVIAYLPWQGYESQCLEKYFPNIYNITEVSQAAYDIAALVHPIWDKLTDGVKSLMARNVSIILGQQLDNPSDLVLCYQNEEERFGGTRQGMHVAMMHGIPVINLWYLSLEKAYDRILNVFDQLDEGKTLEKFPKKIDSFRGTFGFLSNFHGHGVTTEHEFQAAKCADESDAQKILEATSPVEAKKLGKGVKPREDWNSDQVRIETMRGLLQKKFTDPVLKKLLASTTEQNLVEGNYWHDNFWGDCSCPNCQEKEGLNYLGKLLMGVRDNKSYV